MVIHLATYLVIHLDNHLEKGTAMRAFLLAFVGALTALVVAIGLIEFQVEIDLSDMPAGQ